MMNVRTKLRRNKEMIAASAVALTKDGCPFLEGGALADGLHVDFSDPECYARTDHDATGAACVACIGEHLVEETEPDVTVVVAFGGAS